MSDDWGDDADAMRAYSCPSCGAELICDETTAATSCPYCGNPTVVPGKFAGALKPEYVLPFKLAKEDAVKALKAHYKGKPFLPKAFSAENHVQEIKGVYVPFWMFDGEAEGWSQLQGLPFAYTPRGATMRSRGRSISTSTARVRSPLKKFRSMRRARCRTITWTRSSRLITKS